MKELAKLIYLLVVINIIQIYLLSGNFFFLGINIFWSMKLIESNTPLLFKFNNLYFFFPMNELSLFYSILIPYFSYSFLDFCSINDFKFVASTLVYSYA